MDSELGGSSAWHGCARRGLRQKGVYLITGGLGGIGLELAEHLAKTVQARLVLVGRRSFPARSAWNDWLETNPANDGTSRRIRKVQGCEAAGGEVLIAQADVTKPEQMRRTIREACSRFGSIHGVFHAAGTLDDNLIQLKTSRAAHAVMAPKIAGAVVLEDVLKETRLDFLILFSSVSSQLGLPGQVDYTAANAFLDAFAQHKTKCDGTRTLAIDWGAWREVGLAAAAEAANEYRPRHPWLDRRRASAEETVFTTSFGRSTHWLLAEHAIKGSDSIIPGTGYLEPARAAFTEDREPGAVEMKDVFFHAPFVVRPAETKELCLTLRTVDSQAEFAIRSESEGITHVTGKIAHVDSPADRQLNVLEIRKRCDVSKQVWNGFLDQAFMDFGSRWANVQSICYGRGEALISIALPHEFVSDLKDFRLHPALLDMATGGAQRLIAGFDGTKDFYIPFSYGRLLLRTALPAKLLSHVRLNETSASELAVFDVTLFDDDGRVVAEIKDFTMKRVTNQSAIVQPPMTGNRAASSAIGTSGSAAGPAHPADGKLLWAEALREGMLPKEGIEALDRILGSPAGPQMIVSSIDLEEWAKRIDLAARRSLKQTAAAQPSQAEKGSIVKSGGGPIAEGGQIERRLAGMWSDILGVESVGLHDDFFKLGGHSLLLIRLATRIEREFKKAIPIPFLFQSPTIDSIARFLRDGAADESGFLVPFREKGTGPAFFFVHPLGGEVMGARHLTAFFDQEQRFYGIQVPPEKRTPEFAASIESMASRYVDELLTVDSKGPYILGGWSAGSPVALEMAHQLTARGRTVNLVVAIDGCPFNTGAGTSHWNPLYY